jgi:hypothetical protein
MEKNSDPGSGINTPDPQHWCFQGYATHICGSGCQLFSGDPAATSQPCHRQMGARRGGPSSQSHKTLQGNSDSAVNPDWIRMQLGPWIRIRIRIHNPDPGGQK